MRRRHDRARVEKREGKHTMKSFLQTQQAGLDLAIAGTPNGDLLLMMLTVNLSKSLQLIDSGAAVFDFAL
jgi:hypothetical protein